MIAVSVIAVVMSLAVVGLGCHLMVNKQLEPGDLTAYLIATQAMQR